MYTLTMHDVPQRYNYRPTHNQLINVYLKMLSFAEFQNNMF